MDRAVDKENVLRSKHINWELHTHYVLVRELHTHIMARSAQSFGSYTQTISWFHLHQIGGTYTTYLGLFM